MVVKVACWETTDGKLHRSEASAQLNQDEIDKAKHATERLDAGDSIGSILRSAGYPKSQINPILDDVTKDTKLVISHWQCCDRAGYKPVLFLTGLKVRVYGDVGAWSGPYGGDVTIHDLAEYAKRTARAPGDPSMGYFLTRGE